MFGCVVGRRGGKILFRVEVVLEENLRAGRLAFAEHGEHDVLRADHVALQVLRLYLRELEYLLRARSERDVAQRARVAARAEKLLDLKAQFVRVKAKALESAACLAVWDCEDRAEYVLRAHVGVVEVAGSRDGAFDCAFRVWSVFHVHVALFFVMRCRDVSRRGIPQRMSLEILFGIFC